MQRDAGGDVPGDPVLAPGPLRISSAEIFHGRRDIVIVHRGQEYRLHITKADKLILTK